MIFQGLRPAGTIKIIPVVKSGPGHAELFQRASDRQMRLLDQADDLELLGCGVSHSPSPPSAIMLFLTGPCRGPCSPPPSFSSWPSRRRSLTSSVVAALAVSPASRRLPASRNSFDQL